MFLFLPIASQENHYSFLIQIQMARIIRVEDFADGSALIANKERYTPLISLLMPVSFSIKRDSMTIPCLLQDSK